MTESANERMSERAIPVVIDGQAYVCAPVGSSTEPPVVTGDPWRDIRDEMPVNEAPDGSAWLARRGGWWQRTAEDIDGITIHHTLSHDPHAVARYIVRAKAQGGKGYPTTQYHIWITREGEALLCVDLTEGLWHDHCGDRNAHISIGMAGSLDRHQPSQAQLAKAAAVTAYLMDLYGIALENVAGHTDWARKCSNFGTGCPGWDRAGWRSEFYAALAAARSA